MAIFSLFSTSHRQYSVSDTYSAPDWIFDLLCISFVSLDVFEVALGLAHNAVAIFNSELSTQTLLTSEINCILYPITCK